DVEHRVPGVFGPGATTVVAVRDVLVLERLLGVMAGVDGDERRLPVFAEAAGVLPVHYRAAGENHDVIRFAHRPGHLFPPPRLTACPQLMWPHWVPSGLNW